MVINLRLYSVLKRQFGVVKIHNEGIPFAAKVSTDAITQKQKVVVSGAGEYYAVCCPKCKDTRFRLWINHRWDTEFDGMRLGHLAVCYNEHCEQQPGFQDDLRLRLRTYAAPRFADKPELDDGQPVYMAEVTPPGECTLIHKMPADHPAVVYLRDTRKFDINVLGRDWFVSWCEKDTLPYPHSNMASQRIIIPVYAEVAANKIGYVGWQARYFSVAENTPTPPSKEIAKYYTAPGMKKSKLFFNGYRMVPKSIPVFTEGPFDAIRVGPCNGLALFGTDISYTQLQLISRRFPLEAKRLAVIALDPDAKDKAEKLKDKIRPYFGRVIVLDLPNDPGDISSLELWGRINQEIISGKNLQTQTPVLPPL
jgi:hypothetical protein